MDKNPNLRANFGKSLKTTSPNLSFGDLKAPSKNSQTSEQKLSGKQIISGPIKREQKCFQTTRPDFEEVEETQKYVPKNKPKSSNLKNSKSIVEEPEDLLIPNDPKVIEERRAKIKKIMLTKMQNNPNAVVLLQDADLKYLFNLIDEEYFDTYLQDHIDTEKINLIVRFGKAERTGGSCEINPPCKVDVMISRPIFLNVYLGGNDPINAGISCRDGITCLMITLEHEMVHLILNLFFGDEVAEDGAHGPLFRKTVHDVFGHTKTYHELLPPPKTLQSGLPSWKNIVDVGDKVRIKDRSGKLIECVVVEVNKKSNARTFVIEYEGEERRVGYDSIVYHYKNKETKKA